MKAVAEDHRGSAEAFKQALLAKASEVWRDIPPNDDCTFVDVSWDPSLGNSKLPLAS